MSGLNLQLLPDKPQAADKGGLSLDFESLPDKPSSFNLNLDSLPDKPKGFRPIPELRAMTEKDKEGRFYDITDEAIFKNQVERITDKAFQSATGIQPEKALWEQGKETAFTEGFKKSSVGMPLENPEEAQKHPVSFVAGSALGKMALIAPIGRITSGIIPIATKVLGTKMLFPTATRIFTNVLHSFITGVGTGAVEETGKQIFEKDIQPVKIAKEAGWEGLSFAAWGVIPGTKIGAEGSRIIADVKRGLAAAGVVGTGTGLAEILRKHKLDSDSLVDIGVNAITAGILQGYRGSYIAEAYKSKDINDFLDTQLLTRIKSTTPGISDNEARAIAGVVKWGIFKKPAIVENVEARVKQNVEVPEQPIIPKFASTKEAELFGEATTPTQIQALQARKAQLQTRADELRVKGAERTDAEDAEGLNIAFEKGYINETLKKAPTGEKPNSAQRLGIGKPESRIKVISTRGKTKPAETIGQESDQTGLNFHPDTEDEILSLSEKYDLDITLTGGSEAGHKEVGEITHGKGRKFDARLEKKLNSTIESWGTTKTRKNDKGEIEKGYVRPDTNNIYWKEGNHWDVEVKPIEPSKEPISEVKKAKILKNVVSILPEDIEKVKTMREQIAEGIAGKRIPVGEERTWIGIASTFPDYFKKKGYAKKATLAIINAVLVRKPVTEKQQAIFDDLFTSYKEQLKREVESYEQSNQENDFRTELAKQGYSESDIEAIIRETQKVSESEVIAEGVGITGIKFFKTPEEAIAYIEKAESLGGKAEIVRVSPEEVEVRYALPETLTPNLEIREVLKSPQKKDLFQEEGELFKKKPQGEIILDEYRKSILPEYNTNKDIIALDALVDKIRELDPKKDDIDYEHGYRYEAKISYPHSLGENGNTTTFYYKFKPTIAEIYKDILEEYKDFKKEVNKEMVMGIVAKTGRDENIEAAIDQALKNSLGIKPEQKGPPGSGGHAFAMPLGGLEEWIKRTQEQNIQLKPLEMPELVKLAVDLMGKYPVVKKLVKNLGLFKFGKGIALDVKIFKNPQIAGIVLGHEIGHLKDWLPDYYISRGNILGRIAVLKHYMKSLLAEKPGMEGTVLTPKDRERLRRVAEQELKTEAKLGEREVIEEILREIPIYAKSSVTADTVLSLWKEAATEMRTTHPELYKFIAELSGVQKNSVIKQALRGIVDERILQMYGGKKIGVKIVKETVKRTVTPVEITPQNIARRFKQLLKEEIAKRKLFSKEEIMDELKKVTQWWNPFDDSIKGWHTNYRYSAVELYAEAISVLLNKPEKLEELAPKFYKAFWNYIDRKPKVKKALLELQDFLNMGEGEKLRVRQEDIYSMFKKGEELFYDKRKEYELKKKSLWFRLRVELIDKNTALLDKIKEAEKQGKVINPEDNPKYYLEEYNYIGGKIKNLLGDIDVAIITPLENQGVTQENIGEYLFLNRVITERGDIANPLGHNRETAQRQLDYLHTLLGDEKFSLLSQSVDKFQGIMKQLLLDAEKVGLYKPEIIEKLITNPAYATFQVLDYLDDYVAPSIINQIGTLKPIANPFASTILKMISTLRMIERIKTNNSVITFLSTHFPREIIEAKVRHISKYKSEIPEKEGFEVIKTRESGKLAGYYVDPYIAQSVNAAPRNINNAVISVLRFFNSSYFRPVYVNLNLGFQTFNAIRDFTRAWKLNPNVNFATHLGYYWKALPIAKQRIWGNFTDPVIKEMQQSGMLSFTYNNIMRGVSEGDETQIEFLLRQYEILKRSPRNPILKVFNFIEELGDFIETTPKVAGYLARLKSKDKVNIKEIAHQVRIFSGSPDFLRKGAGYDWYNNVFLFSNAIKEGIRGDIEGAFKNPKTRSGYWWRTAKVNFISKILMILAGAGYFGQKIKENFDKQTEYDKTNYITIPLGMTEEGKAIYFRVPQDEMGRLLGGIFWKGMSGVVNKELKSVQDIGGLLGGQVPSMAPEIELLSSWAQYLTGKNPYDWFKGREILSDDERMAGGWYSLKPMFAWTAGKLGIYGATIKAQNDETVWEKVIKFTPIVQRFIRITDYGEIETERKGIQERNKAKAIRMLERRGLK